MSETCFVAGSCSADVNYRTQVFVRGCLGFGRIIDVDDLFRHMCVDLGRLELFEEPAAREAAAQIDILKNEPKTGPKIWRVWQEFGKNIPVVGALGG